jgi:rubrerythrin
MTKRSLKNYKKKASVSIAKKKRFNELVNAEETYQKSEFIQSLLQYSSDIPKEGMICEECKLPVDNNYPNSRKILNLTCPHCGQVKQYIIFHDEKKYIRLTNRLVTNIRMEVFLIAKKQLEEELNN